MNEFAPARGNLPAGFFMRAVPANCILPVGP